MNTKLSLLAGAALAVLGFAAPANASVFTQTVTFGPAPTDYNGTGPGTGSVLLFDTNGGTLNSITFSSSYGFNSTITVSDNSQTGSSGNANTESAAQFTAGSSAATTALNTDINTGGTAFIGAGSLSPIAYDIQGSKSQYTLAPNGGSQQLTSTGTTVSNAAVTDTTAADLAAFSNAGGGNLAIGFDTLTGTNLQNTGGNTSAQQATTATGTLTITYNYTVATPPPPTSVPEPASMLVLGTGLVGLGLARRRRQG